jgi:hypothetical protein
VEGASGTAASHTRLEVLDVRGAPAIRPIRSGRACHEAPGRRMSSPSVLQRRARSIPAPRPAIRTRAICAAGDGRRPVDPGIARGLRGRYRQEV